MTMLLVGVGGFVGAIARYLVDVWAARVTGGSFPFGTLLINVSGTLLLGFLFVAVVERAALPSDLRAPVMIGFIGAYTTFSTWMLESLQLAEKGELATAIVNVGGSVALGIAAILLGVWLGRLTW